MRIAPTWRHKILPDPNEINFNKSSYDLGKDVRAFSFCETLQARELAPDRETILKFSTFCDAPHTRGQFLREKMPVDGARFDAYVKPAQKTSQNRVFEPISGNFPFE